MDGYQLNNGRDVLEDAMVMLFECVEDDMLDFAMGDGFIHALAMLFDHEVEDIEDFDVGVDELDELRVEGDILGHSIEEVMDFLGEGLVYSGVLYQLWNWLFPHLYPPAIHLIFPQQSLDFLPGFGNFRRIDTHFIYLYQL